MSALCALDAARAAGIEVQLDGEDLIISTAGELPADILDLLRTNKTAIVEYLRAAPAERASCAPDAPPPPPAPAPVRPWSAADWRLFHNDRQLVAELALGKTPAQARAYAHVCCIREWCRVRPGSTEDQAITALVEKGIVDPSSPPTPPGACHPVVGRGLAGVLRRTRRHCRVRRRAVQTGGREARFPIMCRRMAGPKSGILVARGWLRRLWRHGSTRRRLAARRARRRGGADLVAPRLRSRMAFSSNGCRRRGIEGAGDWAPARQFTVRPAVAGSFGRMDHARHGADLYETPPEAIDMLLRHMTLEGPVLEPSAGRGAIVRELRRHGLQVRASDLHDHGAEPDLGIETGVDFLSLTSISGCRSIVMNPPFKDSEQHVRHALRLLPDHGTLAVLLRTVWINAIRRADLLEHYHTAIIAGRLKMLPPGARDLGHNGTTDFAWFIMRREIVEAMRLVQGQVPLLLL